MPSTTTHPRTVLRRFRIASAALAAACALAACGGGGDDGSSSSGNDDGGSGTGTGGGGTGSGGGGTGGTGTSGTSADCSNAADFHVGTAVDYDIRTTVSGSPITTGRTVTTTSARQSFAGANPLALVSTTYGANGNVAGSVPVFEDLVDGNVILYGSRIDTSSGTLTTTFEPPLSTPIATPLGQTLVRNYRIRTTSSAGTVNATDVTESRTYAARETLTTPIGTFSACRYDAVTTSTVASSASVVTGSTWFAAEGPYRGQLLKFVVIGTGGTAGSTSDVTRMTYTPK